VPEQVEARDSERDERDQQSGSSNDLPPAHAGEESNRSNRADADRPTGIHRRDVVAGARCVALRFGF
jgi:hypothetical protein